jgi:hypothetical protein
MQALTSFFNYRLRAGVLQLTLGIGIIISVICGSMIMLAYFSKLSFLHNHIEDNLRDNAISGVQYGMALRDNLPLNQTKILDLFGDETDSVAVMRKPWGLFEVITARAEQGGHVQVRTAMITALRDEIGKAVMYIPEINAPLYLTGKSSVRGVAYLSERKFSTGFLNGRGFEGSKLFDGEARQSDPQIKELDTMLLHEIKNIRDEKTGQYQLHRVDLLPVGKSLSFHSDYTNYYYTNQSIDLSDTLIGNLIIHSGISVRITSGAVLSDIILIAPDIDIDNDFKGNLQCFATRSITVGRGCVLEYPSALALLSADVDSLIVIREDAQVNGLVVIPGISPVIPGRGRFRVEKNALFWGMAYVNSFSEIRGKVWGHIMTRSLAASMGSSVYPNYLLDGELNGNKNPRDFPGSLLWGRTQNFAVVKWMQ